MTKNIFSYFFLIVGISCQFTEKQSCAEHSFPNASYGGRPVSAASTAAYYIVYNQGILRFRQR